MDYFGGNLIDVNNKEVNIHNTNETTSNIEEEGSNNNVIDYSKLEINNTMSVNQLRGICKDMGLALSGSKSILIARINKNR